MDEKTYRQPIIDRIEQSLEGRITFADYMDTALYGSHGYYTSGRVAIGYSQDFATSPELSGVFGECMGQNIIDQWHSQGRQDRFDILEMGAGNGTWADQILTHICETTPELYHIATYTIAEISPALVIKQSQKLRNHHNVQWTPGSAVSLGLAPDSISGVAISNELPDAFPVHRVAKSAGAIVERFVSIGTNGEFITVEGPPSEAVQGLPEMQRFFAGNEKTVSPSSKLWMEAMGRILRTGSKLITIDYGARDPWLRLQSRPIRTYGDLAVTYSGMGFTPQVASHGAGVEKALEYPGQVDITSHVNFSALMAHGRNNGLEPRYYGLQRNFLRRNGYKRFTDGDHGDAKGLIDIFDGSGKFRVLEQEKVMA